MAGAGEPENPARRARTATDLAKLWEAVPFARVLGLQVQHLGPDGCRLKMIVRREHCNADGVTVHGGVLASLIDSAVGGAVLGMVLAEPDKRGQTTVDLNVSYLEAARSRELIVEAKLLRKGRSVVFGEAEVRDEHGTLCAAGRATYMIWRQQ